MTVHADFLDAAARFAGAAELAHRHAHRHPRLACPGDAGEVRGPHPRRKRVLTLLAQASDVWPLLKQVGEVVRTRPGRWEPPPYPLAAEVRRERRAGIPERLGVPAAARAGRHQVLRDTNVGPHGYDEQPGPVLRGEQQPVHLHRPEAIAHGGYALAQGCEVRAIVDGEHAGDVFKHHDAGRAAQSAHLVKQSDDVERHRTALALKARPRHVVDAVVLARGGRGDDLRLGQVVCPEVRDASAVEGRGGEVHAVGLRLLRAEVVCQDHLDARLAMGQLDEPTA